MASGLSLPNRTDDWDLPVAHRVIVGPGTSKEAGAMLAQDISLNPSEWIPKVVDRYSPLIVDHAQGMYIWDTRGDRYLDFTSGIAVTNTGHCHPRVVKAIQEQAAKIIHAQQNIFAHESMMRAAAELTATLPDNLNQVYWANGGTEAVEAALKLAKAATKRPAIIAFRQGFHGRTYGSMSVTSSRSKIRGHYEPLVGSIYFAPYPYLYRNPYNVPQEDADLAYFAQLEYLFDTLVLPDDVAAILMESMIGEGGYLVPTARWVQKVRELCDRHGILLIMDEIQSGAGRTGTMWCFEHYGVVPDIMTTAKGLGSGMPVSAMVSSREIMDNWAPGAHGSTYGGNAVATAAVVATLEVIHDEHLVENAAKMGKLLFDGLLAIQRDYPVIGDVRGLGLMIAAEFVHSDKSPNPEAVEKVIHSCFQNKVLLISCGTYDEAIRIIPPLIVNQDQIREFLELFRAAVSGL